MVIIALSFEINIHSVSANIKQLGENQKVILEAIRDKQMGCQNEMGKT